MFKIIKVKFGLSSPAWDHVHLVTLLHPSDLHTLCIGQYPSKVLSAMKHMMQGAKHLEGRSSKLVENAESLVTKHLLSLKKCLRNVTHPIMSVLGAAC